MSTTPQDNWINEERIFYHKCVMVYEAYLETLCPGWTDHYSDQIVDALLTHWMKNEPLDRVHAQTVATKWLIPLLRSIPKGDSLSVCPKCGHKFKE